MIQKSNCLNFPGDLVVKDLSANSRGHRFSSWSQKSPHAAGQLSPCSKLLKPESLEAVPLARNRRNEKLMYTQPESSPCSPPLEEKPARSRRPSTAKDNLKKYTQLPKDLRTRSHQNGQECKAALSPHC